MLKNLLTIQMLPIVLIILAIVVYTQIRCIKKVLNNIRLDIKQRVLWIAFIIVFNYIGIVFYLIATRNKPMDYVPKDLGNGFDENANSIIFIILFFVFVFLMLAIIRTNPGNILITTLFALSTSIIAGLHFFMKYIPKLLRYTLPYILVLIVTYADLISIIDDYKIVVLVAVAIVIIKYPLEYTRVFYWTPLPLFLGGSLIKFYSINGCITQDFLMQYVFRNSITYMMVIAAFYFAKRQLLMNNYLQYLMRELKEKSQELEEASIVNERNRIAREIHDTLGHTLTGAIIQLEVAKSLIYTSPEKAEESIKKTQDITRQGFNDVKRAIKALRPIMIEENTLYDGLMMLFERMEKDYGFRINHKVTLPEVVTDEMKVSVYRIVQELITNSMRHGQADEMDINIDCQFDTLRIDTKDNGIGCTLAKEGNGLIGIRERAEKLKGHVEFSSSKNNGFGAIVYIPIQDIMT